MQNLVRTFAFMLVVLLAAASAVVDAQTNDKITANSNVTATGNYVSVVVFTVPE